MFHIMPVIGLEGKGSPPHQHISEGSRLLERLMKGKKTFRAVYLFMKAGLQTSMRLTLLGAFYRFAVWWREALVASCEWTSADMAITRHMNRAHMKLLGPRQVEETTWDDFDWVVVVLLDYPILSSRMKTLGRTLVGHTWQWRRSLRRYPD